MYTFVTNELSLLGNCITLEGVHLLPEKVKAVPSFPMPSTVKALHHQSSCPIYFSFKGKAKDLKWGSLQEAAIYNAALSFPVPNTALLLYMDASKVAIRAVLKHVANG
ncbi:uncharacterized protein [Palaemon carinicauda]|uniref:uncharacterized protein n=1 Tax=Palaemon carinicauda TaxID=392227 RepID=UPI0035B5BA0C